MRHRTTVSLIGLTVVGLLIPSTEGLAQHTAQPPNGARISVLTILPGDQLYSAFGHTALRVTDPATGIDHVYNYGTFDPDNPGFYRNFALGKLDYRLSRTPFGPTADFYYDENRPIIEQRLRLTPAQVARLIDLIETNYLPENRYYRYDFFFDNCSTRPRDLLEQVPDANLSIGDQASSGQTFRQLIDPYQRDNRLVDFGIDLGLGSGADREATNREATFLPLRLLQVLAETRITTDAGALPLVMETDTLFWMSSYQTQKETLPWVRIFLWVVLLVAATLPWVGRLRPGRQAAVRWFDAALFGLSGIAGLVVVILSFFSEHAVTPSNWNLMWAWPTNLLAAIAVLMGSRGRLVGVYFAVLAVVSLITLALWYALPQVFHPALVPLLLLIAYRAVIRTADWRIA